MRTNDKINIYHEGPGELVSFTLWSIEGVSVRSYDLDSNKSHYTLEELNVPSGLYFGIATDLNGNQFTSKIVIVD